MPTLLERTTFQNYRNVPNTRRWSMTIALDGVSTVRAVYDGNQFQYTPIKKARGSKKFLEELQTEVQNRVGGPIPMSCLMAGAVPNQTAEAAVLSWFALKPDIQQKYQQFWVRLAAADSTLGNLEPSDVLYSYDGPCLFTTYSPTGARLLVYAMEPLPDGIRYLVSATTGETVKQLTSGRITVRAALISNQMWIADKDSEGFVVRVESTTLVNLPENALPDPHLKLWVYFQ